MSKAEQTALTGNLASASSRGFSPLFRHISSNDISMTAPVETRYPTATLWGRYETEGDAAVSFLYRSLNIVPQEIAKEVQFEDIPYQSSYLAMQENWGAYQPFLISVSMLLRERTLAQLRHSSSSASRFSLYRMSKPFTRF